METTARLRYLRMSPRKVRLITNLIQGWPVDQAMVQLQVSKKDAVKPVLKLLRSAVANALHNHDMKRESLFITKAVVDGGPMLKRWQPRAMGRATPIRKRTSHVVIVLSGESRKEKTDKV